MDQPPAAAPVNSRTVGWGRDEPKQTTPRYRSDGLMVLQSIVPLNPIDRRSGSSWNALMPRDDRLERCVSLSFS
jgi:hypothetical protein